MEENYLHILSLSTNIIKTISLQDEQSSQRNVF